MVGQQLHDEDFLLLWAPRIRWQPSGDLKCPTESLSQRTVGVVQALWWFPSNFTENKFPEKTNPEKRENFEFVEDLSYTETFEETNTDNLDKSTKDDTTWQNMDYCSKVNIWQNMNKKMNKTKSK